MSAALTTIVDELVDVDASGLCDGELRARFVEVRREIDRLESYAARMLVGVHGRGIPSGEGASSTHATFDGTTFTVTNPDGRHIGSS
jgi:hypothetical protein